MAKVDKTEKNPKKQRHFWKDFKAELKKVIWPTRSQVINNTVIVIVIVAIITALCFVLDLAFEALNTYGIDKLKSAVQSSVLNTIEEDTTENENTLEDENTVETQNAQEEDTTTVENLEEAESEASGKN